jgi:UPF0716 family protein affecting phage T7 exclusion
VIARPLLVDVGIALAIAVVIVLISPGWAVTFVIALIVLLAWTVDALIRRWRWRRRPARRGDPIPPRRRGAAPPR